MRDARAKLHRTILRFLEAAEPIGANDELIRRAIGDVGRKPAQHRIGGALAYLGIAKMLERGVDPLGNAWCRITDRGAVVLRDAVPASSLPSSQRRRRSSPRAGGALTSESQAGCSQPRTRTAARKRDLWPPKRAK